jgi:hypothetical protein
MYLSDNGGSFTSAEYSKKVAALEQALRFAAGVGAHHQNGNAERAIQTIMSVTQTMRLHAAIQWSDVADTALWPIAVAHPVFLHNHVPNPTTSLAPSNVFTKSRWDQRKFHDVHVWVCPVYVLDSKISGDIKLPRWTPGSVHCINVGISTNHASAVPLVLNPASGYIKAKFHIVFDYCFATIATDVDAEILCWMNGIASLATPTISTRSMKTIWSRNVTNSRLNMRVAKLIVPRFQRQGCPHSHGASLSHPTLHLTILPFITS